MWFNDFRPINSPGVRPRVRSVVSWVDPISVVITLLWVRDIWLNVNKNFSVTIGAFTVDLSLVQEEQWHVRVVDVNWVIMVFNLAIPNFAVDIILSNDGSWWSIVEALTCSGSMNKLVVEAVLFNLDFVGTSL